MAWRPARSLLTLHAQLRPLAPNADPRSWGLKGDEYHDSTSDHAPKDFPGWANDVVTAADFPDEGQLVAFEVLDSIRLSRDVRVKYGISEGRMFSSYPTHGYQPFVWRPYVGADGHFTHGHLSVVGDARADDARPWATAKGITQEDEMKPIMCNLRGRASVFVKWPGEPLRALTSGGALDILTMVGATKVVGPHSHAIVDAFGPVEGMTRAESIAYIDKAG
jgi:hypothetical protein